MESRQAGGRDCACFVCGVFGALMSRDGRERVTKMTHTKVRYLNRVVVLAPQQKLLGGPETEELQEHIERLDAEGNQFLVVNLEKVPHLVSAGIAALLRGHKSYRDRNGRMVLCCLNEHTLNIFIIMKLVAVFDIYETEEVAVASFAASPPVVPTA